jgi:hypothetical protein
MALRPVVIYDRSGNRIASLVSAQMMLHAGAAVVLWDRVRADLNIPVVVWQDGTGGQAGGMTYLPPTGSVLGDIRLGADVRLYGQPKDGVAVAVGARLFLPTGAQGAYTSDGATRFWPHVALAGEAGDFVWAGRVGYHVRPTYKCGCTLTPGSEVTLAMAGGFRALPTLLVGPELYASTAANGQFAKATASPLELLLGAHYALAPEWAVSLGVAPGLTDGAGSPAWRFVAGVQYWPAFVPAAPPPKTP